MGADRPWVDGEGIPAEDETNNSDMTLPKVNLALLRDDMSRFLHLTVLPHVKALV